MLTCVKIIKKHHVLLTFDKFMPLIVQNFVFHNERWVLINMPLQLQLS